VPDESGVSRMALELDRPQYGSFEYYRTYRNHYSRNLVYTESEARWLADLVAARVTDSGWTVTRAMAAAESLLEVDKQIFAELDQAVAEGRCADDPPQPPSPPYDGSQLRRRYWKKVQFREDILLKGWIYLITFRAEIEKSVLQHMISKLGSVPYCVDFHCPSEWLVWTELTVEQVSGVLSAAEVSNFMVWAPAIEEIVKLVGSPNLVGLFPKGVIGQCPR
jgi:hypothetical protein